MAVIPTAANSPGRHGAFYKTRVVVQNLTDLSCDIEVTLCGPNGIVSNREISLKPRGYQSWENFLDAVFNYRGAGAVIMIASDSDGSLDSPYKYSLSAEVYTDSPNGRFSTTVVNGIIPLTDLVKEAFHAGITVNDDQRVNIGVFNPGDSATITARVYDDGGTQVQRIRFDAETFRWMQKSVTGPVDIGYIEWEISAGAPYLWAVTVDNNSNDETLVWAALPLAGL